MLMTRPPSRNLGSVLAAMEDAIEVGLNDRVPFIERHLLEGAVADDAGIVDEDVEPAARLLDPLHDRFDLRRVANISAHDADGRLTRQCSQLGRQGIGILVIDAAGIVPVMQHAGGSGLGEGGQHAGAMPRELPVTRTTFPGKL